jgi:hypothetical protein
MYSVKLEVNSFMGVLWLSSDRPHQRWDNQQDVDWTAGRETAYGQGKQTPYERRSGKAQCVTQKMLPLMDLRNNRLDYAGGYDIDSMRPAECKLQCGSQLVCLHVIITQNGE